MYGNETREESLSNVGAGWRPILEKALDDLDRVSGETIVIQQTKEKFGELRIYTSLDSLVEVQDITTRAAQESVVTCEFCGGPGTTGMTEGSFWIKTACPRCRRIREETGKWPAG